jgi:DNA-binding GntR family transcriptional regulator
MNRQQEQRNWVAGYMHDHVDALNALKQRDADKAAAAIHADIESARADVYALLIDRQSN